MQPPMIETLRKRLTDREHPARLHLIGVAGSGMSGLALMLMEMGHRVSGCDRVTSAETSWQALSEMCIRNLQYKYAYFRLSILPDVCFSAD